LTVQTSGLSRPTICHEDLGAIFSSVIFIW